MSNRARSPFALLFALLAMSAPVLAQVDQGSPEDQAAGPFAVLDGPIRVGAGERVRFSAAESFAPEGRIVWASIVAEGGRPAESKEGDLVTRFAETGSRTVVLEVVDDRGRTARATKTVVVEAEATPAWLRRWEARRQSALVVAMVENGGLSPYARFVEGRGQDALRPFAAPFYDGVTILAGLEATPAAFFEAIRRAAAGHRAVDILVFAHGSSRSFDLAAVEGEGGRVTSRRLVEELEGRGGERLRMVWSSTCKGRTLVDAWRAAGARAVVGASDTNRPFDFPAFWLAWLSGREFRTAVLLGHRSNRTVHEFVGAHGREISSGLEGVAGRLAQLEERWPELGENSRVLRRICYVLPPLARWDIAESTPTFDGESVAVDVLP